MAVGLFSLAILAHAQEAAMTAPAAPGDTSIRVGGAPLGGLREEIENSFAATGGLKPAAPDTAPSWQISPAITVQEEWTDNAYGGDRKQSSFVTVVTPEISISGTTSRLTASLFYAPSLYWYTSASGQSRVGQNLVAEALVTLVPDTLFLDLRGFAAEQSVFGGVGPAGTTQLNRQNALQTYSFSASPYLVHRFGGWGTGTIGVSDTETSQGVYSGSLGDGRRDQWINTRREYASFVSGEEFGRLLSTVTLSATQSSGSGALDGAYRDTATYLAGYAVTRSLTALASIGWEDIRYGEPDPLHVNDITWAVGGRWTPNPDSSITVMYGHQDGVTAASLDAVYAITPRTRVYATYSEGISTDTEQLQNALTNAQLDGAGTPINGITGAPLLLTDNFFGFNDSVYKVRNASATLSWLLDRDAVQATVQYQEQTPIGRSTATDGATASKGTYGSVAWEHEVSDAVRSNLFLQYGRLSQSFDTGDAGSFDADVVVASAAVTWQISDTLSASAQYSYTSDSFASSSRGTAANLVVVGLRKSF